MSRCPWCGRRIVGKTVCGYCDEYERLLTEYWELRDESA